MKDRPFTSILLIFALLIGIATTQAAAQDPAAVLEEEVVIVAPYPPGGSVDVGSRTLSAALERLGVSARVVNRPGAAGVEGTYWTAQRPATGYTVVMPGVPALVFQPLVEDVGYTLDDFDPVALWITASFGWAVQDDAPWQTLDELMEYIRDNPGAVAVGSTGARNTNEWLQHRLASAVDSEITYVSYGGGGEVTRDLIGGHIDVAFGSVAGQIPYLEDGQLRVLAHADPFNERIEAAPDIQSARELGYDIVSYNFFGLFAPAGVPDDIKDALAAAVQQAAEDPEARATMQDRGLSVTFLGPDDMESLLLEVRDEFAAPFLEWEAAQ